MTTGMENLVVMATRMLLQANKHVSFIPNRVSEEEERTHQQSPTCSGIRASTPFQQAVDSPQPDQTNFLSPLQPSPVKFVSLEILTTSVLKQ